MSIYELSVNEGLATQTERVGGHIDAASLEWLNAQDAFLHKALYVFSIQQAPWATCLTSHIDDSLYIITHVAPPCLLIAVLARKETLDVRMQSFLVETEFLCGERLTLACLRIVQIMVVKAQEG